MSEKSDSAKNDNKCPSRSEDNGIPPPEEPGNAYDNSVLYILDANIPRGFDRKGMIKPEGRVQLKISAFGQKFGFR